MRVDGPDGLKVVAPKGETTHYILCVAVLLQNVFAVHRLPAAGCVEGLWTRPLGVRVQRVQRVQRVVVAADAADFKKYGPLHYFTSPPSFRGAQVIEEPSPPALDNFQPSCYHLLKIRSLGLHTVELRFLSIRNISRSALFSVGRLFLRGSLLFLFSGGLYESI